MIISSNNTLFKLFLRNNRKTPTVAQHYAQQVVLKAIVATLLRTYKNDNMKLIKRQIHFGGKSKRKTMVEKKKKNSQRAANPKKVLKQLWPECFDCFRAYDEALSSVRRSKRRQREDQI